MKNYLLCLFLFGSFAVNAQRCGTIDYLNAQLSANPTLTSQLHDAELKARAWEASNSNGARAIITVPVVVHVIYKLTDQNISDAQIQSQIDVLNEDYRRQNADASQTPSIFSNVAADCEILFCLAARDPSGNPTNGITRTETNANSFNMGDAMKNAATGGKDAWETTEYLNIWVCNMVAPVLGFATLPGSASAENDGVVIDYQYFGRIGAVLSPYNKGRTATHEVGHWLNLKHIWGDDEGSPDPCAGTDQVSDTPNQEGPTYGCPSFPAPSCGNTSDMFTNFMDYTNDACMNIFTAGQKLRMLAALNVNRPEILASAGCVPPLSSADCDTLNNITGGDGLVFYYAVEVDPQATGYLTGHSTRLDNAFSEKYNAAIPRLIYGVRFDFALATTNSSGFVTASLWDNDGANGGPGTALATENIPLAAIAANVASFTFTDIAFSNPSMVVGDYYIGFSLTYTAGDTISVYSNQFDDVNSNTAWFRDNAQSWHQFVDDSTLGALSLAMRPIQCLDVGIKTVGVKAFNVFPNPSQGNFSVSLPGKNGGFSWELYSMDGKKVRNGSCNSSVSSQINTGDCSNGLYLLRIVTGANVFSSVVSIQQ